MDADGTLVDWQVRSNFAGGITNAILLSMILLIAGAAIYMRYYYQPRVDPQYVEALMAEVSRRFESHSNVVEDELASVGRDVVPIVKRAFVERAREDYSLWAQTLEREGSEYFNNVEAAFVAKVKARYHEYLQRHREILRSEFPEHATRENVEQILASFEATFDELVERYYLDQFRHEASRTERLWKSIPPARAPRPDEPALEQQLADTTRLWMLMAFRGQSPSLSATQQP